MTVLDWRALSKQPLNHGVVITIGVFDGLHRGHRILVERVVDHGGGEPAVLSFDPLPRSVLSGTSNRLILSRSQKERYLKQLGIQYLIIVDFSRSFSNLTGEEFVSQLLRRVPLRGVVVGQDFRCGRGRETDTEALRQLLGSHGVDMEVAELIRHPTTTVGGTDMIVSQGYDGTKVSSSSIRQAIDSGDLNMVRSCLGRDYELDVEHARPNRTCEGLEFIASSLTQILPGPGRYSGVALGSSGRTDASITVEPDRVMVHGAFDSITSIGFGRRES